MFQVNAAERLSSRNDAEPIHRPVICAHCGKKAKTGVRMGGKEYAKACAADLLGLRPATLNKLLKG